MYDHFLALDRQQFQSSGNLETFSQNVYQLLELNFHLYPLRFQRMFPYMKSQNWLLNYRSREGIQKSFEGLVYRAVYLSESAIAFDIFNQFYQELETCYKAFFPELKEFAFNFISNPEAG
ncbi:MAG: acyl carrier protein phosphodiesterase [Ginsengibacter sp.]